MKLLCINNKKIEFKTVIQHGTGLEEGKIYKTVGKKFNNEYGQPCYYIEGLGQKLCCRFTELLEDEKESESEIAVRKLKEEFQLN